MLACPQCHAKNLTGARVCSSCGTPLLARTEVEATPAAPDMTAAWTPPRAAPPQNDVFVPGTLLLDRYRVLSLLGKGGMGTVYLADDLTLGQQVALKFMVTKLEGDAQAIELLRNEVRTARRVSHANVCRVHDIGEIQGRTFVSMEYVDGEDLASLLRRIGRLPGDKATQIARQLCAGLHAAHERGVLHRDLKPANVMIDGRGDARITDFGIAAAVESIRAEDMTGTPGYMAPELFTGAAASVRSDLYALGLVLWEIYLGTPLFRAASMTELLRQHREPVQRPTTLMPELDSRTERVILSCLERDPDRRPRSALAVLAAFPGGDPLALALASGQTPSAELVAAAGGSGVLHGRATMLLAAAVAVGWLCTLLLEPHSKLLGRIGLPKSVEVLADKAHEHVGRLGHSGAAHDSAYGFELDRAALVSITKSAPDAAVWASILQQQRNPLVSFWYRQTSSFALVPNGVKGRVTWTDPPPLENDLALRLDATGRLQELRRVPGPDEHADPGGEPDWTSLLAAAGLERSRLEATTPIRIPHAFADQRVAWRTPCPETGRMLRIEAAALGGKPLAFTMTAEGDSTPRRNPTQSWRFLARVALVLVTLGLAWSAFRRRRSDARGAVTVGAVMLGLVVSFTLLAGHRGDWTQVGGLIVKGLTHGLIVGVEFGLYYFALEPHVRRIWPETMVSWSRLMTGRGQDPLIGRHVLVGQAVGVGTAVLISLRVLLPRWAGTPEAPPVLLHDGGLVALLGPGAALGALLEVGVDMARAGMMFFMSLVVMKLLLRRPALAAASCVCIWATVWSGDSASGDMSGWLVWVSAAVVAVAQATLAIQAGLVAVLTAFVTYGVLASFPLRVDAAAWHAYAGWLVVVVTLVLTVLSARAATRSVA